MPQPAVSFYNRPSNGKDVKSLQPEKNFATPPTIYLPDITHSTLMRKSPAINQKEQNHKNRLKPYHFCTACSVPSWICLHYVLAWVAVERFTVSCSKNWHILMFSRSFFKNLQSLRRALYTALKLLWIRERFEGNSSLKNENFVIIESPLCVTPNPYDFRFSTQYKRYIFISHFS